MPPTPPEQRVLSAVVGSMVDGEFVPDYSEGNYVDLTEGSLNEWTGALANQDVYTHVRIRMNGEVDSISSIPDLWSEGVDGEYILLESPTAMQDITCEITMMINSNYASVDLTWS